MSYNPNFYNNFRPNFTFHPRHLAPPFLPPPPPKVETDEEFVKRFDKVPLKPAKYKVSLSINEAKDKLRNLILTANSLKEKEKFLKENINSLSEEEWAKSLQEIEHKKSMINESMANINDTYLDTLRKLLAKRSAKRLRLKRVRIERKKEKEDWIKEREEKSRKIDENLQKIKDDIEKAKQEEEAKIKADIVLKEVLRKKHDAKKCIEKLDAMLKLYRARQNTARSRGQTVNERSAESFNNNVEKLKSLWIQKLQIYDKEESELRATLKQDNKDVNQTNAEVQKNLDNWMEFLYGCNMKPQVDFQGDVGRFVAVRSQWDQFIHDEGTSLPVGWVLPNMES